jgi:excisionase family DNA binding protein
MHNNELITMKTERIASFFKSLDRMLDDIENMVKNHKPTLNGERYLTDREVSARLKVSRRTLQDYRNEGRIPYYQLGGKVLYRESDIQRVLDSGYREAFR